MGFQIFFSSAFQFWTGLSICAVAASSAVYQYIAMQFEAKVQSLSVQAGHNLSKSFISPFQESMKQAIGVFAVASIFIVAVTGFVVPITVALLMIPKLVITGSVLSLGISLNTLWMERRLIGKLHCFLAGQEEPELKMVEKMEINSSLGNAALFLPLVSVKVTFVGEAQTKIVSLPSKLIRSGVKYTYMLDAYDWKNGESTSVKDRFFTCRNILIPSRLVDDMPTQIRQAA